ncbi:hypothetical protein [Chryseobacterium sp. FDAARGOS 1104]|uniref:Uncharacterized protein n=2 Tax=Chryseobacterium taihuense TaxID=1141221 RepID=A0A4U8WBD0_9FLAO|nr:hypothetical protein [Chryseobacterium sp. FDAARGOS 1104]QQV03068.1 hypothetical protein I6I61_01530 [Chryseobacterium sp. FDAARGOS 1104]VFB03637.1 Uncharacterised protein [Chryseobacterium taihuense]
MMSQQNKFKIIDRNSNEHNPYEFIFFGQNPETFKTCTKHKEKEIYFIVPWVGNYALHVYDKQYALDILNSNKPFFIGDILETDSQEEIEKITPENIEEKSKEFLNRFNKNFKLDVNYNPKEEDIDMIDERVKKTTWNTENIFLLNFYMMEVTKRKFNFSDWSFRKVYTFNPFNEVLYIGRDGFANTYYSWLDQKKKKYFDFRLYLGLVLPQDAPSLKKQIK